MIDGHLVATTRILVGLYGVWFFQSVYFLPSVLRWDFNSPVMLPLDHKLTAAIGLVASAMLAVGALRRSAAVIQLVCLAVVLRMFPLVFEIHLDYWGWLLVFFVFAPGEQPEKLPKWPWSNSSSNWALSKAWAWSYWISFGASYSLSGLSKLNSKAWTDGEVMAAYFKSNIPSLNLNWIADLSPEVLQTISAIVAWPEALALPLALFQKTRGLIWLVITVGQLQMIFFSRINHISIMMVIFSLFAYDKRWHSSLVLRLKRMSQRGRLKT